MEITPRYHSNVQEIRDILDYIQHHKYCEWTGRIPTTSDTLAIVKVVLTNFPEFAKAYPEWSRRLRYLADAEVVHSALMKV